MNIINRLSILILLIVLALNSYSQDNLIKIEKSINKYYVDSIAYNQIDFLYTNSSDIPYILWIEKNKVDSLSTEKKIKKYFYTTKGDFNLADLVHETLINEISIELFMTFVKIIKPKEQFQISIIKMGEINIDADYIQDLDCHIVIVKANESKRLPNTDKLDKFNYKAKSITILADILKK
jgi:hypothetical protein